MNDETDSGPHAGRSGAAPAAPKRGHQLTDIDAHVGTRLMALRQARGLSRQVLAERIGVTYQQVQKYESGGNRISVSMLFTLAETLGADVQEFFPDHSEGAGSPPATHDPDVLRAAARIAELPPASREVILRLLQLL